MRIHLHHPKSIDLSLADRDSRECSSEWICLSRLPPSGPQTLLAESPTKHRALLERQLRRFDRSSQHSRDEQLQLQTYQTFPSLDRERFKIIMDAVAHLRTDWSLGLRSLRRFPS